MVHTSSYAIAPKLEKFYIHELHTLAWFAERLF